MASPNPRVPPSPSPAPSAPAVGNVNLTANRSVKVGGSDSLTVAASQTVSVGTQLTLTVGGERNVTVQRNDNTTVRGSQNVSVTKSQRTTVNNDWSLDAKKNAVFSAADSLTLVCGSASLTLRKDGTIVLKGIDITIEGAGKVDVKSPNAIVLKGNKLRDN